MQSKNIGSFLTICLCVLLLLSCSKYKPDTPFPIIAWYGPEVTTLQNSYNLVKEAGFTVLFPGFNDPSQNLKALDAADSSGLQLLLSDPRIEQLRTGKDSVFTRLDSVITDYQTHPAFWGYYLHFEAGLKDIDRLMLIKNYIEKKDSVHYVYLNLLPIYTPISQLDTTTYTAYCKTMVQQLNPKFISTPLFSITTNGLEPEYYKNLEIMNWLSEKFQIPFWTFVLTTPHSNYVEPSLSRLKFQVFSALAHGATGLEYFTYATPNINSWKWGASMVDENGAPTHTYNLVKSINNQVNNWIPYFSKFTPKGTFHSSPVPTGSRDIEQSNIIIKINGSSILAGFFKDEDNHQYVLLVNKNYTHGSMPLIYFSPQITKIREIPKNNIRPLVLKWTVDEEKSHKFIFKAGGARLFRLYY